MECPKNGGSNFYDYKGFHGIALMAICDSNYCFSMVDIGGFGKDNDADIFGLSDIALAFDNKELDIPEDKYISGHLLPNVIISDEIFSLNPWLMKPYPDRNLAENQRIYNYRLSRAR